MFPRFHAALAALSFAAALSCHAASLPCGPAEKECAYQAAQRHPVRRLESWAGMLRLPVDQRMGPASPSLVEYLTLDNIANGFPERPRAANLSADFVADVHAAIAELPPSVKRLLGPSFAGVYFVEDLGGSGYTDYVRDGSRMAGGFIVLDVRALGRSANAWATWKEASPFRADGRHAVQARIASAAGDDRRGAIQYILLHELGHVLSIGANVHPTWTSPPKDVGREAFPYFTLSWRVNRERNRYESIFDDRFERRRDIVYYLGARLRGDEIVSVYDSLERTSFPTLYAATNPFDDFAEAFANYVHVVLMKKPFEIAILDAGRPVKTYEPCWQEARCAQKRRIIEQLLAR